MDKGGGLGVGLVPLPRKTSLTTETKSIYGQILLAEAMTCEIPNDSYLTWNEEITPMKCRRESHLEPSMRKKSLMKPKHKLRIGAWNVRTMYQCGKSRQVSMEMDRYQLDILGISELRWTGFGKIKTGSEQIILYSGAEEKHERGVALIINKETAKSLLEWEPISERILRARFYSKYIKLSIIQVYLTWNEEITPMKCRRESHLEPSMRKKSLVKPKHKLRIGAWNVRTMYQCGKSRQVSMEMDRYQLDILGISELRWTGFGKIKTGSEQIILYSGAEEKHERGVALIINKETAKSLLEWEPISERILRARFYSKYIKLSIIQVYAPTNDADEEEKETFYDQLQCVLNRVPKHDMIILMGDLNAKVGKRISDDETSMGNESPGERNENGELFVSLCELNSLNIGGSRFKHREIHKCTWTSPDGRTKNQIDHIAINNKFRSSLRDVRAMRGADVGSDHYLILAILKLKLRKSPKKTGHKRISYDIAKLKAKECRQEFSIELKNRFELLKEEENHGNTKQSENEVKEKVEETWEHIKNIYCDVAEKVLGEKKGKKSKEWITGETLILIESRRKKKIQMETTKSERLFNRYRQQYSQIDREVKKSARKDKRKYFTDLANEAQDAAQKGQISTFYQKVKQIKGNKRNSQCAVRDKNNKLLTTDKRIEERWREYFEDTLNAHHVENSEQLPNVTLNVASTVDFSLEDISLDEVQSALRATKPKKAAGRDGIVAEMLKADFETATRQLQKLFNEIWRNERIPEQWKEANWIQGFIVSMPQVLCVDT
nr:uncharacterized protein LOC122270164 [Parasteatoda tepidariorum]